jgi:hypothetical protein
VRLMWFQWTGADDDSGDTAAQLRSTDATAARARPVKVDLISQVHWVVWSSASQSKCPFSGCYVCIARLGPRSNRMPKHKVEPNTSWEGGRRAGR